MRNKLVVLLSAWFAAASPLPGSDKVEAFWQATRERLSHEPMEAQIEPVAEALPYKKFSLTLRSLDGVRIRVLLSMPTRGEGPHAANRWPVIVSTPGYGGLQQGVMLGECQRGYVIMQVFPRGQGDSAELWKVDGPDKLTWRLDRPEGAYYQGAYADVMRAIDYAVSRPDFDPERIALAGTSQGGGFSLAVGALDPRVKAVVAHVPFLCDFRLAARIPNSLVKTLLDRAGRNDESALATLDCFDPFVLAPRLRAPVLMSAGGRDETCPQATIQATCDRIAGEKTLKIYPELVHTSCLDFYNLTWPWLDANFRKSAP